MSVQWRKYAEICLLELKDEVTLLKVIEGA